MGLQDMTLRPSLKDIDEELLHLVAEQSAANDMLAEKRQKDQALLDQMLPPQVNTPKPCRVAFNNKNNDSNKRKKKIITINTIIIIIIIIMMMMMLMITIIVIARLSSP